MSNLRPLLYYKRTNKKRAFSLIEISIVILVVSVLFAGGVVMSKSLINSSNIEVTNSKMKVIYEAMGQFLANNGRLPCPASITKSEDESRYGEEPDLCLQESIQGVYSSIHRGFENVAYGMVPVKTLGLEKDFASDGFGSKIAYVVNSHYTVSDHDALQDDSVVQYLRADADGNPIDNEDLNSQRVGFGNFAVLNDSDNYKKIGIIQKSSNNVIDNVAFVIISHGGNENGAYRTDSATPNEVANTRDDYVNAIRRIRPRNGMYKAAFGRKSGSVLRMVDDKSNDKFDDILMYKTVDNMVSDFEVASLLPCIADSQMQDAGYRTAYAGESVRGDNCQYSDATPIKVCGSNGRDWIDSVDCPGSGAIRIAGSAPVAPNNVVSGGFGGNSGIVVPVTTNGLAANSADNGPPFDIDSQGGSSIALDTNNAGSFFPGD